MWGFWLKAGKLWELSLSPCNNKEIFKILLHIVNAVWAAGSGNGPFLMPFARHYQCEINPQVVYGHILLDIREKEEMTICISKLWKHGRHSHFGESYWKLLFSFYNLTKIF